jgi:hypothetical protein
MKNFCLRTAVTVTMLLAVALPVAAATPAPKATPAQPGAMPTAHLSTVPLHSELLVEVNKKGQVVRVKSGTASKNPIFNTQTYGNALQMWIRRPDGSAQVGLYKVVYDYDPKTHAISRNVSLVQPGGSWADEEGAANAMMDEAKRQAQEAMQQRQKVNESLPSLEQIRGAPSSASPSPSPLPH